MKLSELLFPFKKKRGRRYAHYLGLPVAIVQSGGDDTVGVAEDVDGGGLDAANSWYLGSGFYMEQVRATPTRKEFRVIKLGTEEQYATVEMIAELTSRWMFTDWHAEQTAGGNMSSINVRSENTFNLLKFKWWVKNCLVSNGYISRAEHTTKIVRP